MPESARIGGIAGAGEIVASVSTVSGCDLPAPFGDRRAVTLKGLAEPVEVVSVLWQDA